jgi:hypothetical protein
MGMFADSHHGRRRFHVLALALLLAQACAGRQSAAAVATPAAQPSPPGPRVFLHAPEALARHKARWLSDPQHPEPALARLLDDARKALAEEPFSVTEKNVLPPSGDKHDYLSLAPYAWPDPRKPDGLPYLMRDGQTNPERDSIADHAYFSRMVALTETLGLAYYFSGDEVFAKHAALLLRTFFVEPATRMNPNLNFAQGVRGKEAGRATGIIDTAGMARLLDGAQLLMDSPALSKEDRDGLLSWFRDYLAWLRESELGRREGQARNNHGTWYDVQVVSLALATGQIEVARETLQFGHKRRIGRQIEPDGRQPEELTRTKSWHYSIFNLQAFVALAAWATALAWICGATKPRTDVLSARPSTGCSPSPSATNPGPRPTSAVSNLKSCGPSCARRPRACKILNLAKPPPASGHSRQTGYGCSSSEVPAWVVSWLPMSESGTQDSGASEPALVDESLIDAMMALSPEERLRLNDRMVRTILLLRQSWEAANPGPR